MIAVSVMSLMVGLPAPYASFLSTIISEFTVEVIEKFKKGHDEHGGNLFSADLKREINNEHIDLFVYRGAEKHRNRFEEMMNKWIKDHESTSQAIPAERT